MRDVLTDEPLLQAIGQYRAQGRTAAPNTVVISDAAARLAHEAFALADLGAHDLKGVSEPLPVFRVNGMREVDRDTEDTASGGIEALVEQTYSRTRELCQQLGETPQLFVALRGLWLFYQTGGRLAMAREVSVRLHLLRGEALALVEQTGIALLILNGELW